MWLWNVESGDLPGCFEFLLFLLAAWSYCTQCDRPLASYCLSVCQWRGALWLNDTSYSKCLNERIESALLETRRYNFQPPTPTLMHQTPRPEKFPNVFNNGLWLYRTSYSKDVWTSTKYHRLSQQQLGFLFFVAALHDLFLVVMLMMISLWFSHWNWFCLCT